FLSYLGADGPSRSGPDSQWENSRRASSNRYTGTLLPVIAGRFRRKSGAIRRSTARTRPEYRGASLRFSISQNRSKRANAARFNRDRNQSDQAPRRGLK